MAIQLNVAVKHWNKWNDDSHDKSVVTVIHLWISRVASKGSVSEVYCCVIGFGYFFLKRENKIDYFTYQGIRNLIIISSFKDITVIFYLNLQEPRSVDNQTEPKNKENIILYLSKPWTSVWIANTQAPFHWNCDARIWRSYICCKLIFEASIIIEQKNLRKNK